MLKLVTAGESHGRGMLSVIYGLPSGIELSASDISQELLLRRKGYGRGHRMNIEKDEIEIISGVFKGMTNGAPLSILVRNTEYPKWAPYIEGLEENEELDREVARPGHADFSGAIKFKFDIVRPVLERASARHTVSYVAAGAVFKKVLKEFDIEIGSILDAIGNKKLTLPSKITLNELKEVKESDYHTLGRENEMIIRSMVDKAESMGTTLGGSVIFCALGVVPGLGSYADYQFRMDFKIGGLMHAIPSVKAVEIGSGIKASQLFGFEALDEFKTEKNLVVRDSNFSGGIEGGVTNGEPVFGRIYFKPIPTQKKPLKGFNLRTQKVEDAFYERSDIFVGKAIGIIAEAMLSYAILQSLLEKFGGDNIEETIQSYKRYVKRIKWKARKELHL
ncbi:MAG: chorismate synthase [Actinobacteria bacterium]|nr:chorismate synthase [Actinomycetota bacterium]